MIASQELTTGTDDQLKTAIYEFNIIKTTNPSHLRLNLTQYDYRPICRRGAQACVLAFSCVDRESFKCVPKWKKKVEEECGSIPMVLVMTKLDLLYRAEVDSFEVEKLSRQLGIRLIKTSVKENINIHKVNKL